jgi:hypothetical protein
MKHYAQFFQYSALDKNRIIEACGDRSVIILDGRISKKTMGEIAKEECIRRGYVAWQIHQGNFRESKPISNLWYVDTNIPVKNPAWLSAHSM